MAGASKTKPEGATERLMKACTVSGLPMKCQASANLWWPSSKTSGPPPAWDLSWRQASALAGTFHAVLLAPGLDFSRMVTGSPMAPSSISALAFITGG